MYTRYDFATTVELAEAAAAQIAEQAAAAIAARGRFSFVLAGGSTPRLLYTRLAQPPYRSQIDWARVAVFWGDERHVPPDHPDSNYGMASAALLTQVPLLPEHIISFYGAADLAPAPSMAQAYETRLRVFFGAVDWPRFDLVLLGMGEDGHTASLFPHSPALLEQTHWATAHYVAQLASWRLTLTLPALNAAAQIMFLVAGSAKQARLHDVLHGAYRPDDLPAQAIQPIAGALTWLVAAQG